MPNLSKFYRHIVSLFLTSSYAILLQNISWMMIGEVFSRASRFITLIVLGYCLTPTEYGIAMLSMIIHEIVRVFTRVGSGSKIIQCEETQLSRFASNAITLQWILCIVICTMQIIAAPYIALYYNNWELELSLKIMALSHLIYPLVTVRVFLVQRENNMRFFSKANAQSIIIENLSTALFAFLGMSVLCIAFAKLCSAFYWVFMFSRAKVNSYKAAFDKTAIRQLVHYASKVLSSEILKTSRQHIDSLLAARFLSPELFGLYSFAKSAGVGLSLSISSGYLSSVYPYLCTQAREGSIDKALLRTYFIACGISGVFLVQAALAPSYISLIFDEKWQSTGLMVAVLCLSAVPTLLIDTLGMSYRAKDKPGYELLLCAFCTLSMGAVLVIIQPSTPMSFAMSITVLSWSWMFIILYSVIKIRR